MHCRVGEINIICTELDRSLRFYRDVLGFEVLGAEGPAYHLACGGTRFLLLGVARRSREALPYCQVADFSIDLLVPDLDEARRHMQAAGVETIFEPSPSSTRFFIRDPDGLVIELIRDT
jgi:catechol 2,3-dioxygenase